MIGIFKISFSFFAVFVTAASSFVRGDDGLVADEAGEPRLSNSFVCLNPLSRSWENHKTIAQKLGGNLITISDADVSQRVIDVRSKAPSNPFVVWAGGNDIGEEGTWSWADGSAWDYTNWNGDEPNNNGIGGVEDCLLVYRNGPWNDGNCDRSEPAVYLLPSKPSGYTCIPLVTAAPTPMMFSALLTATASRSAAVTL